MQKVTVACLILFSLWIPKLYSQSPGRLFEISAAFGPSFPVGNFGKAGTDSLTQQSAAKPGPSANASIALHLKNSHFGFNLIGSWQQNKVNSIALGKAMTSLYPSGYYVQDGSDSWHIWKLLAGPIMTLPIKRNSKTSFVGGIAAGILTTTLPDTRVIAGTSSWFVAAAWSSKTKLTSICYQANANLDYQITRAIFLHGSVIFSHATPVNRNVLYWGPPISTSSDQPSTVTKPDNISQKYPISTINVCVGIAYTF